MRQGLAITLLTNSRKKKKDVMLDLTDVGKTLTMRSVH